MPPALPVLLLPTIGEGAGAALSWVESGANAGAVVTCAESVEIRVFAVAGVPPELGVPGLQLRHEGAEKLVCGCLPTRLGIGVPPPPAPGAHA